MPLPESQALGRRCAAHQGRAAGDGSYRITGQKIFITYGEHDLTDNIIHFVLARLPMRRPAPKYLAFPGAEVSGQRRRLARCAQRLRAHSVEHKLGIHASPTCTMVYGDRGGAVGYLVGEENRGLACMFTMMNLARLAVACKASDCGDRTQAAAGLCARAQAGSRDRHTGRIERDHRASGRQTHAALHARSHAPRA